GDSHCERASRTAVRGRRARRRRRRERRHTWQRAAHGVRRREGLGHRLARGGRGGARRLQRVEVRQPDRRSGADMTVAVLGPGAVGGVLAAGFLEGGVDVVCISRPATADVIRSEGLSLRKGEKALTVRPRVETELREPVELLLVTVKAPALEDALERMEARADAVMPLLNGIEHMDTLRRRFRDSSVAGGSIGRIEAWLERPGVVVQPTPSVVMTVAGDAPAELLRRSGVEVRVDGSAEEVLWEKLARQAATAAVTSIAQRPV